MLLPWYRVDRHLPFEIDILPLVQQAQNTGTGPLTFVLILTIRPEDAMITSHINDAAAVPPHFWVYTCPIPTTDTFALANDNIYRSQRECFAPFYVRRFLLLWVF